LGGREGDRAVESLGNWDERGAVDEVSLVLAKEGELRHGSFKACHHELLLVDETLPEARGARVASQSKVGLQTEHAGVIPALGDITQRKRRSDFAGIVVGSGEANAFEKDLQEDTRVEGEGSSVERSSIDGLINLVSASDAMRGQKSNHLEGSEVAGIGHAIQDFGNAVLGLGNESIYSSDNGVLAASLELKLRSTRAVGDGHGTSKLDQVCSANIGKLRKEGDQVVNTVGNAVVGGELGLDQREKKLRAVSTSTGGRAHTLRDGDRVICIT
jgi:hypothetical protein